MAQHSPARAEYLAGHWPPSVITRRRVLALFGALAAMLVPAMPVLAAPRDEYVWRDGWLLRREDLDRLGIR